MADYRAYTIGHDGHFRDCDTLSCDKDRDAIEWAKKLVTTYTIELWCGGRFVAKLEPKPEQRPPPGESNKNGLLPLVLNGSQRIGSSHLSEG